MLPPFGQRQKTPEYNNQVQKALSKPIKKEWVQQRVGPGGMSVQYFDTSSIIQIANQVFGFNGWSHQIMRLMKNHQAQINGRYTISYTALVRVSLPDGTYHEDIGAGTCLRPSLADAMTHAQKSAVSDALKRCLRHFGAGLGCEIDKHAGFQDNEIFVHKDELDASNQQSAQNGHQIINQNPYHITHPFEGPGEGNFLLNQCEQEDKPIVSSSNNQINQQKQITPRIQPNQLPQQPTPKLEVPSSPQRTVIKIRKRRPSQVMNEQK